MDQNQQNQTPPPDYNFILNQGQPAAPGSGQAPQQPKKRNKKVIIIIVLLVLLAITAVVAILLPDNQQDQNTPSVEDTSQAETVNPTIRNIATDYITHMANGDFDQAYDIFSPDIVIGSEPNISREWFVNTMAPAFAETYQVEGCVITAAEPPSDSQLQITCPFVDTNEALISTYEFDVNQSTPIIKTIRLNGVEQL